MTMMPVLPEERAPREAPNRLLGSWGFMFLVSKVVWKGSPAVVVALVGVGVLVVSTVFF